ncbi:MAG: MFS transporter [Promethearchaeota archaeon]|nr:MAG: MFS transporter [Candidatus Lokiarchaeota archaeon]
MSENKQSVCDEFGETHHSTGTMASFSFQNFINEFLNVAFGMFVFYFYEVEIGLNVILTSIGFVIYALWNAVNDPLVGYLTDRPFKFTRKWGRRFPWIIIGSVGWILAYILIFTPPNVDPESGAWIIFIWLVVTTCTSDTLASVQSTNFLSLFPDKFRGQERAKASGLMAIIGFIGIALGSIGPPLFIEYGNLQSYITQAGILAVVGLVAVFASIKGVRDEPEMVERYLKKCEEIEYKESFFTTFKSALKQKNYRIMLISYFLMQTTTACLLSSIIYVVRYILEADPEVTMYLMVGFLLGALGSSPFWSMICKKVQNNYKMMIISSFLEVIFLIPLLIGSTFIVILIGGTLFGISFGGYAVIFRGLVFPDVIDETVVIRGKRQEGVYIGIRDFFGRLSFLSQAIIFAAIHILTGFDRGVEKQTQLAKWGISIHFALVPMICTLIVAFLFIAYYDLKPAKTKEIREKIMELKL